MASSFQIGRLLLGPPFQWHEAVGDPVTNLGGAAIPAPRQALRHMITIGTVAADGYSDTLADRLRIRRQLRGMLNNTPLKLQSYLYVIYSDDPDQNGWYVPDFGQLADLDGSSGLATGVWQLEQVAWIMAGHRRINREARNIWMKDLRTGLFWRDSLRMVYSTDFAFNNALQLSVFPHGATSIASNVSGLLPAMISLPAGRDGGICKLTTGLVDLATLSYDRADTAWGLSDVIAYDRRNQLTAPTTGPDTQWEEVYGPDHAWSWNAATPSSPDAPVLDNGLVRVRYDQSVGKPGFSVDVWNGSAYVEQGKMIVWRSLNACDTWISAGLLEYTPDRAVVKVVLARAADPLSREQVFITLQRGEIGATFECYPAPTGVNAADCSIVWTPALNTGTPDLNTSITKSDAPTGPAPTNSQLFVATAGTGAGTGHSGPWFGSQQLSSLGMGTQFAGENWLAILRCPTAFATIGPYQHNLAVVQAANAKLWYGDTQDAYGVNTNLVAPTSQNLAGYLQVVLSFSTTVSQQIMEAEAMTLGTNTTTTTDALASGTGSNVTQSTRLTDANPHVSQANWPNSQLGSYRVFARVKTSANTGNFYVIHTGTPQQVTPFKNVGTGADNAGVGTVAWTSPGNVINNNPASPATCALTVGQVSHYIAMTNFGFSIPTGSIIQTITFFFSRYASTVNAFDNSVKAIKGGSIVGTDKSTGLNWPNGSPGSQTQYGGDLWGTTWTPADVNASNFGFGVAALASGGSATLNAYMATAVIVYLGANGTVTVGSTAFIWLDLGELSIQSVGNLELHAWMNTGGTLTVDRIESQLMEDRLRNSAIYSGARDVGQAALYDSRMLGALVSK